MCKKEQQQLLGKHLWFLLGWSMCWWFHFGAGLEPPALCSEWVRTCANLLHFHFSLSAHPELLEHMGFLRKKKYISQAKILRKMRYLMKSYPLPLPSQLFFKYHRHEIKYFLLKCQQANKKKIWRDIPQQSQNQLWKNDSSRRVNSQPVISFPGRQQILLSFSVQGDSCKVWHYLILLFSE